MAMVEPIRRIACSAVSDHENRADQVTWIKKAIKWRWAGTRLRLVAMEQSRRGCVGEGSVSWVNGAKTGFWLGAVWAVLQLGLAPHLASNRTA